jgi:hypothetical protein
MSELLTRAPVEVLLAVGDLLRGPLRDEVDAVIGDLEEHITRRNLEYCHVPLVAIHGTVPYADPTSYKYAVYLHRNMYPFAFLVSDLATTTDRVTAIRRALAEPGRKGILAMIGLKILAARIEAAWSRPRASLACSTLTCRPDGAEWQRGAI